MDTNLTVNDVFRNASLTLKDDPVLWGTRISDLPKSKGVYVVARVGDPNLDCEACDLPFINPLPPDLVLDLEYERQRWLPNEPVLYIGGTTRTIRKRIGDFYNHKVGNKGPHAGGQVVRLLKCDRWVYWSPTTDATDPMESEKVMISAFKKQVDHLPFANGEHGTPKRIRRSS
ncbi:MAG: hypothetical protein ACLQVL_11660 [Terriglobia bacterium]